MPETTTRSANSTTELPETVYLVNEELENQQVKYHVYVPGSYHESRYGSAVHDCLKPRCGQDRRFKHDADELIEVPVTTLIDHLLPGMCRRCLNYLGLPQPETDTFDGVITVTDSEIKLVNGTTVENVLPETHPYRTDQTLCGDRSCDENHEN